MAGNWKSILGGAAVAATLILPAIADDAGWTSGPWRGYDAKSIKVDNVVGKLGVEVKPQAQVSVQISGTKKRVSDVDVRMDGDQLVVEGEKSKEGVWDWRNWFNFDDTHNSTKDLDVHIVVPKGTDIDVRDMIGDAAIGDTMSDVHFEAVASNAWIGRAKEAHLSMVGSGKINIADVAGDLPLDIAGSGKIKAGSASEVHADVTGSGSADMG